MLLQARRSARMGGRPATARIHMFETVHESSGCQKVAHAPLAQPRLPARLGGLQADAPASAAQRAMGVRPGRALIHMFETVHESSGCQKIAHVPLAQPRRPARLGGLQADAPASAAQRAMGVRPGRALARLSMSLQGASNCSWPLAQPRRPARTASCSCKRGAARNGGPIQLAFTFRDCP